MVDLFTDEPAQWGLRGDPYVWREMRKHLAGTDVPGSLDALESLLRTTFAEVAGTDLNDAADMVYREEYATGGMSSGMISLTAWRERLMPLLISRGAPHCATP